MSHPYASLPESAFWRTAVGQRHFSDVGPLWSPKFEIRPEQQAVTFGSCFAQHIGRALSRRGFKWLCTEPPPTGLSEAEARRFNYNIFSCRTANIYTTSLLLQWVRWAIGDEASPDRFWTKEGRYFDPFRPTIEPDGFASIAEVAHLRQVTIAAFGEAIRKAETFLFTMGLTENWRDKTGGFEYPLCPGTVCGEFDPDQHIFRNLDVFEVVDTLRKVVELLRGANGRLRVVLTVSPVSLVATNSGRHVLIATSESKAVLRAAAAQISRELPYVDYFPSYEIITHPFTRGGFFEPNQREVSQMGVDFVMDHFFRCIQADAGGPRAILEPANVEEHAKNLPTNRQIVCEEELLGAFASEQS